MSRERSTWLAPSQGTAEPDETNNLGSSAPVCDLTPTSGGWMEPDRGVVVDELGDRLIVFGGDLGGGADSAETWVLANVSGRGGEPSWSLVGAGSGPSARARAVAAFDSGANRLIVHGGCTGDCTASLNDTWVLTEANGLGTTPVWSTLPAGASARNAAASAYDEASKCLIVFGGSDGASELGDVQILKDANGIGSPCRVAMGVEH